MEIAVKYRTFLNFEEKIFDINFTNLEIIMKYNKLNQKIDKVIKMNNVDLLKLKNSNKSEEEQRVILEQYNKESAEIMDHYYDDQLELVKEILESNDIEYDHKFWMRKVEPSEILMFIQKAYTKDMGGAKKKVV